MNRAQSAVDLQIPLLPSEENVFPAMLIPSANAVAGSLPVRELGMGAPRARNGCAAVAGRDARGASKARDDTASRRNRRSPADGGWRLRVGALVH